MMQLSSQFMPNKQPQGTTTTRLLAAGQRAHRVLYRGAAAAPRAAVVDSAPVATTDAPSVLRAVSGSGAQDLGIAAGPVLLAATASAAAATLTAAGRAQPAAGATRGHTPPAATAFVPRGATAPEDLRHRSAMVPARLGATRSQQQRRAAR